MALTFWYLQNFRRINGTSYFKIIHIKAQGNGGIIPVRKFNSLPFSFVTPCEVMSKYTFKFSHNSILWFYSQFAY